MSTVKTASLIASAILLSSQLLMGRALAQAPFYQGKTITVVQGRDPGGTGDLRARSLITGPM